jgi:hypothetical protein
MPETGIVGKLGIRQTAAPRRRGKKIITGGVMKTTAEYLELALQFEMLATVERDPNLKADFERQSLAYRKLAAAGMEEPPESPA